MANSYKNIIITPNTANTAEPKIEFRGGNTTVNTAITVQAYPTSNGTMSFEGTAGQLFSVTNDMTGSIFSVNDVSGIPSIEVFANGQINLGQYGGNVLVGTTATILAAKFASVAGGSQNGGGFQTNGVAGAYTAIACARNGNNGYVAEWWYDLNTLVGAVSVTSTATAYNTLSDYRLKDIAGPIANSGAYIDALKPVQGSWKSDGSRFIGLLAHEAQEVSETPIATGEKDGKEMQAMDYSAPEIVANLIAEVQSLRARVAQLEGN